MQVSPGLNKNHPIAFFVLIYAISLPFWILSLYLDTSTLPDQIPLSDIGATFSPAIAACILIYRENGTSGLLHFLKRIFDYRRILKIRWLIIALLFLPTLYLITYLLMRFAEFQLSEQIDLSFNLTMVLALFLIAATVEELAYSAYATDALQQHFSAFTSALLIGVPWALWHLPSMIKIHQSWQLIFWGLLATVAFRVITVWLYNHTNYSLFAVILAHAIGTTARSAFPGGRQAYEQGDGMISYGVIILAAVFVTLIWGRDTLNE